MSPLILSLEGDEFAENPECSEGSREPPMDSEIFFGTPSEKTRLRRVSGTPAPSARTLLSPH